MNFYKKGVPEKELNIRIKKLQSALAAKNISGALIIQKTDLFYFSGTIQQGWLYVPDHGEPLLMVFKDFKRAEAESALNSVISLASPKKIPHILNEKEYPVPEIIGMELDVLPANMYFQFKKIFSNASITDISTDIRLTRAVKSDYEIELMKKAAAMSDRLAAKVPEFLEDGKTEIQVAGELEAYARTLGHQGFVRMRMWGSEVFYGHIMSGASAAVPSYLSSPTGGSGTSPATAQGPGFNKIRKNETILVDYTFGLDGYLSDHTRIFSIGSPPDKLLKAHEAMLEIQNTARQKALPGMVSGDLYELMMKMADEKGYSKYFMGAGERKIKFTGHGLGLELDEFPFIAKGQTLALEKGMTIALEPKIVMPGIGVAGIENTHVVTDNGLESLTKFKDNIVII